METKAIRWARWAGTWSTFAPLLRVLETKIQGPDADVPSTPDYFRAVADEGVAAIVEISGFIRLKGQDRVAGQQELSRRLWN